MGLRGLKHLENGLKWLKNWFKRLKRLKNGLNWLKNGFKRLKMSLKRLKLA